MTKEEINNWLQKNLQLAPNKSLTSGIIFKLRKYPEIKQELQQITQNFTDSESELLYCFFNPNYSKICPICGKPVQFISYTIGYKKACCKKCADMLTVTNSQATKLERYGNKNYNNSQKNLNTKLQRYGTKGYNNIEKIKQTKLERFGDSNYNNPEKNRQTCLDKYGVTNGAKLPETKLKQAKTCLEKYSVKTPMESELIKQIYIKNSLNKRGYSWPLADPIFRKENLKVTQTSNESKIEQFLLNRGFDYKKEYLCNGKKFDFAIFKNGQLSILIETDGEYFHGLLSDYDGKNVRGEQDCERFSKVPEDVKYLVADAKNTEQLLNEITQVFDIEYNDWIQTIIDNLPKEFPYYSYSEERMKKDWEHLCNYTYNKNQYLGSSIVRYFHRSLMEAHVKNCPSPLEAWNNKVLLEECVRNRIIYSSSLSSQAIADGFSVCRIAPRVSVFNPSRARYLIQKYLPYFEIFDPFSGFSGRLLGAESLGKKYIGQDLHPKHVKESQEIIKFLDLKKSQISQKDILNSTGTYECLFTCPPYGGKEHWNAQNEEIEKSCDEWIDECLNRFKCQKYLFVVDQTEKFKDYIVETLTKNSHFGIRTEYVILI